MISGGTDRSSSDAAPTTRVAIPRRLPVKMPQRNPRQRGHEQRHQRQLRGVGRALAHEARHRALELQRDAEVERQHPPQPARLLLRRRQIEAEAVPFGGDAAGSRPIVVEKSPGASCASSIAPDETAKTSTIAPATRQARKRIRDMPACRYFGRRTAREQSAIG